MVLSVRHRNHKAYQGRGEGEEGGTEVGGEVYSLTRRTFVESAQNLTPEKPQGGRRKA